MQEENKNKSEAALREENILEFWRENKIFQKSTEKKSPKGEFVFYEGPPTANAKPALHHLEARAFKDVIPRYKTMNGFHVRRNAGWDTHGLPVELQIEKKLGLKSKKEIEEYGVEKFNKECKESVHEYIDLWQTFTERVGYWVDFKTAYYTYDSNYIESLWNIVAEINKKGLLYKDYKVVPWCPRCGTALSSHELAQGYEDVKDLSIYAKFKVKGQDNTYILAWTTTPWTLPGNIALAVGGKIDYVKVQVVRTDQSGRTFDQVSNEGAGSGNYKLLNETIILAKSRLEYIKDITKNEGYSFKDFVEIKGKDLIGLSYEPLFPYLKEQIEKKGESTEKAFKVYSADFVNTEDGTGIVHTAVMYGADDFELGTKIGLPKFHLVDEAGKFIKGTGFLEGRFVKEVDENGKPTLAVDIIDDLKKRGLFFKQENIKHSYPHCWRCKTALIYYARDSWYVGMSKLRDTLVAENKKINWEPAHIQEGRFGEWLREVKDWAISRERYWGTPLPIWDCVNCNKRHVISGVEDLQKRIKKSGNQYFLMRHGQTTTNLKNLVSTVINSGSHLTEEGKMKTKESALLLKDAGIDLIITSPFNRTRETTRIVQDILKLSDEHVVVDERLGELLVKSYEGKSWIEYHKDFPKNLEFFDKAKNGDESFQDVKTRVMNFLFEIEDKYKDKKILIVTHGGPAWLSIAGSKMLNNADTLDLLDDRKDFNYLKNSEFQKLNFTPYPHDRSGNLDLHRPFIDEIPLVCNCGETLKRTKEVMDVWFDSGSMPFAQEHYPFEKKILYPADYISEAIDQTRGWFYTLLAVGVLMGRGTSFKNVICLGHLLDEKGKKMSKSVGNIVEPFSQIDKFGVDAVRFWMYTVNQPGESKNYDEKTVAEVNNKVFNLLYNVLAFYELYRDREIETGKKVTSSNILDIWILEKLDLLVISMTENLNNYKLLEPARALRDFIGDLSTWYLRRSRERIKEGDREAKQTLYFVLQTLAKLIAPFAPFTAEDIWQKLKNQNDKESVHLESWPSKTKKWFSFGGSKVIEEMELVRNVVSLGLEARQKTKVPVRQPLSKLRIKNYGLKSIYLELMKDELNVKEVVQDAGLKVGIELDGLITPELKKEGNYREFVRSMQDMRKKIGLTPSDTIVLSVETNDVGKELLQKFENDLKQVVLVSLVKFEENDGEEIKVDELVFKVKIDKI